MNRGDWIGIYADMLHVTRTRTGTDDEPLILFDIIVEKQDVTFTFFPSIGDKAFYISTEDHTGRKYSASDVQLFKNDPYSQEDLNDIMRYFRSFLTRKHMHFEFGENTITLEIKKTLFTPAMSIVMSSTHRDRNSADRFIVTTFGSRKAYQEECGHF